MNVVEMSYRAFKVENDDEHYVRITEKGFRCSCLKNSVYNKVCEHILSVKEFLAAGGVKDA